MPVGGAMTAVEEIVPVDDADGQTIGVAQCGSGLFVAGESLRKELLPVGNFRVGRFRMDKLVRDRGRVAEQVGWGHWGA